MVYTREGIMSQVYVAFGQGTGAVRVSHGACVALAERYHPRIGEDLLARWDGEAVQVLERIRAIGRTAALQTSLAGGTAISRETVLGAMKSVEAVSLTALCPPGGGGAEEAAHSTAEPVNVVV